MCTEIGSCALYRGQNQLRLSLVHTKLMEKCESPLKSILNSSPNFHFYYLIFGKACIGLT